MFALACSVALSGIKSLDLVNISVIFGMVVMPFTYYPILKVAGDPGRLVKHANGRGYQLIGGAFLGVIVVCAAAAIPLMILTRQGQP